MSITALFAIRIATESNKYYNYCASRNLDSHKEQQM